MLVEAAIEARAVTQRTRAGVVTVRDVSLTVGRGELVAIIGGSGSGKAALLDALSGVRPPASGTVSRQPDGQIGYVPAGDSLPPVLPLAKALRYTAALRGTGDFRWPRGAVLSPGGSGDAVAEVLDMAGLTGKADALVGALNPGERKRAAIAAELLAGPAAFFLDEPAAALDPAQAAQVLRLLRSLSGSGMTVLFTTDSPLDAGRCDKVAMLAVGGHLAFFGTPAAACGYFGADSLEEIYERLSGLGDPAAAWSRRFFHVTRTTSAFAPVPTMPRAPGPALLIPDQAGPHSAGRPSPLFAGNVDPGDGYDPSGEPQAGAFPVETGPGTPHSLAHAGPPGSLRPVRQLPVLLSRNVDVLARARRQQFILAAAPLAVLLVLCVLFGAGALNGPAAVTLAWAVLGGLVTGLAYEFPVRASEAGVLRRERFTGLSVPAFVAAKAAVLVPALALADLIILAVPAAVGRLQAGFALSYLAVLIASASGLAAATATVFGT